MESSPSTEAKAEEGEQERKPIPDIPAPVRLQDYKPLMPPGRSTLGGRAKVVIFFNGRVAMCFPDRESAEEHKAKYRPEMQERMTVQDLPARKERG